MTAGYDLLFPDNNIKIFQPFVRVLEEVGFTVHEAETVQEARRKVEAKTFEAAVVDDVMGSESGLSLIPGILKKNPSAPIVVFSAYKGPEDRTLILKQLKLPNSTRLIVRSKGQLRVSNGSFREMAESMLRVCKDATLDLSKEAITLSKLPSRFDISYDEYERLSPTQRIELTNEFRLQRKDDIDKDVFGLGYVWALYLGNASSPTSTARSFDEVLNSDEVLALARETGQTPFQVIADSIVEDDGSPCKYSELEMYPRVAFQFDKLRAGGAVLLEAHLDTGSRSSYLNGQWLLECGLLIDRPMATVPKSVNGAKVEVAKLPAFDIEVQNRGSETDGLRPKMALNGWTVFSEWSRFPIAGRCKSALEAGHKCTMSIDGAICRYREAAFLGRSFYIDNNASVTMCPFTATTTFKNRKKSGRSE